MIPVRIYRLLIVLFGISMLVAGADVALSALGMRGPYLKIGTGLFAGILVFVMALEGGKTLLFCAKGLVGEGAAASAVSALMDEVGGGLGIRISVVESSNVFASTVKEGRSHRTFISTGLLEGFSSQGLRGVVAHECGHVRGNHSLMLAVLLGLLAGVKFAFGIPLVAAVIILLAYLWMLRTWEFIADHDAVKTVGSDPLKCAFVDYQTISGDKKDVPLYSELLSGHPSIARRLQRIGG